MLYPEQLKAHQKAYYLLRELNKSFPPSIEYMSEERIASIERVRDEVDEWWASTRFYLDEESQDRMLDAITRVDELVLDYGLPKDSSHEWDEDKRKSWLKVRSEFTRCIDAAMKAVEKGSRKHLEEPEKQHTEGKS